MTIPFTAVCLRGGRIRFDPDPLRPGFTLYAGPLFVTTLGTIRKYYILRMSYNTRGFILYMPRGAIQWTT